MTMAEMKAPTDPFGPSPARRANSIRRTSTIDTQWPEGFGQPMVMRGAARDLFTPAAGAPQVLTQDWMQIRASTTREIMSIETSRGNPAAQALVGSRGGGYLRGEIARVLPDEHVQGTPLHLVLDDFSGASLVAGWAFSRWRPDDWANRIREARRAGGAGAPGRNGTMEGICSGFRPGSSALGDDKIPRQDIQSSARVPPLPRADDPIGWHDLASQEGVGMRRARRIDVWLDKVIHVDVGFQDSSTAPDGGDRIAVHEYHVTATADPVSFEVLSLTSNPRVLPYAECPGASPNVTRLLGKDLRRFRLEVLEQLPGILGCTHLNDVLRSMADVPQLAAQLRQALSEPAA
ncbi:MAG: hypothetical protein JWQ97_1648 [Phenylobacterium sp.]|nr:hypothetical protein [Phenylobacterium sp.]